MKFIQTSVILLLLGAGVQSCCEPEFKDSAPVVLFDSYRDSVVKDLLPEGQAAHVTDSAFYPIYEFQVRNSGTEADSFTVVIGKNGFDFSMKKLVLGGETVTFRTPGPLSDTAAIPAQWYYFSMFRRDTADLPIQELDPDISIIYGEVYKGDEGCNTPASRTDVDARLFR